MKLSIKKKLQELVAKIKDNNVKPSSVKVYQELSSNHSELIKIFKNSSDLVYCQIKSQYGVDMLLVYVDGLVNKDQLNRDVVSPFISHAEDKNIKKTLFVTNVIEQTVLSIVVDEILSGNAAVFIDGKDTAYIVDTKGWERRPVDTPESEAVVRGPKEGFIETLRINTSLLRRKIKNPNLVFESAVVGNQTKTRIEISYIDGIVNQDVLNIVRQRLAAINTDIVLDSGTIEQFIDEAVYSPFSTLGNTQKPDVVAGKINEGRVAIFVDGSPHILTAPCLFVENFQTAEDYYLRPILASVLRFIRYFSFALSISLPALYIALQNYHQEMIPPNLLLSMAAAREGIPLPTVAESFFMVIMFELIRESGTRLPKMIGSAISIVGSLIIGQAAVDAGFVTGTLVVVVAITAVASFVVPSLNETMAIIRFLLIIFGAVLGLYGMACVIFLLVAHTVSLRSFGINYTSPVAPLELNSWKDYFVRVPLNMMTKRPTSIVKNNITRTRN